MKLKQSNFVHRILRIQCPMAVFWFPWFWQRTEIGRIRRILGGLAWREARGFRPRAVLLMKLILWPIIVLLAVVLCLWLKGSDPQRLAGKSRYIQLKELLYFGFFNGLAPEQYYTLRIYLFSEKGVVADFLTADEIKLMCRTVSSMVESRLVDDKWELERYLRRREIPVISNLAAFGKDQAGLGGAGAKLPASSLYFKPVDGYRGRGVERWEFQENLKEWEWNGTSLSEPELVRHFESKSKAEPHVLQVALRNHESLAPLSWGGLITFRVMTVVDQKQEPTVVGVHTLMPRLGAVVSHGVNGGLNAKVDIATRRLLWCFSHVPREEKLAVHPDTGTVFEGFEIELLEPMMALAVKAHRTLPEVFSIGWDMVLTDAGIFVLEGNTQWGIETGMWFGQTALPRCFLDRWGASTMVT
ncbi:MAG: hypothetical protein SynsKO_35790 [Synoicihabitans sp.]